MKNRQWVKKLEYWKYTTKKLNLVFWWFVTKIKTCTLYLGNNNKCTSVYTVYLYCTVHMYMQCIHKVFPSL